MAEDKLVRKKTKEAEEDIYKLNLNLIDDDQLEKNDSKSILPENPDDSIILKGYEDDIQEEQKKKSLSKVEEGIKTSKKRGRPRKNTSEITEKPKRKSKKDKQSQIKMHTEGNVTEITLEKNEYKIELQKEEYNIYTEISESSYIIVREPNLRIVVDGNYILMERKNEEYSVTTNQDFKINYVIDNLERRNNIVNFKLANLTGVLADKNGILFETDEEKMIENNLEDNKLLLISEEDGNVYLPYTKDDIKRKLTENKGKKISEIISENYVVPLDKYKGAMRARFREAYNLMRKKENKSVMDAIGLGLELMFETNLHPAVISGCRNLEELDIYLDCLDDNELEKFSCFKIIYKSLPLLRKKGKFQEI